MQGVIQQVSSLCQHTIQSHVGEKSAICCSHYERQCTEIYICPRNVSFSGTLIPHWVKLAARPVRPARKVSRFTECGLPLNLVYWQAMLSISTYCGVCPVFLILLYSRLNIHCDIGHNIGAFWIQKSKLKEVRIIVFD